MLQTPEHSLGEHYQPLSKEHLADPYAFYALARAQEPIFFSPTLNAYVVTRSQDIRAILANPTVFSSRNVFRPLSPLFPQTQQELSKGYSLTPTTTNADGEIHERHRRPLAQLLSKANVQTMEPMIQEKALAIVETFRHDGHVELMSRFARRLPVEVICDLFDIEQSEVEEIGKESEGFLSFASAQDEQTQAEAARRLVSLHKRFARLLQERKQAPQDDFISLVASTLAPDPGPLNKEQEGRLAQYVSGAVIAAHETTSSSIGEGVRLLLEHPEQWQLLRQQPDLIPDAVEEIVRFLTPGQAFFRMATQEVVIGDEKQGTAIRLPAGSQVLLLYGSANHEEAVCPHAEQFDIHRPLKRNEHLGFGYGIHFCVGAHLARTEIAIALQTLIQLFPHMQLAPNQLFEYRELLTVRSIKHLEVTW